MSVVGVGVEVTDGGGADEETLRIVVAAVETVLRAQAEPAAPNRWRFSGREWAGPGPRRRARP